MSNLISAISEEQNRSARTENGAVTFSSTNSEVLNFFSTAGALRSCRREEIIQAFSRAFSEDRELAMKTLFYIRDCRGGQGERRVFRIVWAWLYKNYDSIALKNIANVPFYGRWDDLFYDSDSFNFSANYIISIINKEKKDYTELNLYKWMPSINTSSPETRFLAQKFCATLHMSARDYRKMLSTKRAELDIVEKKMSANQWSDINFEKVPSKASTIYRKAFWKHEEDRYSNYIDQVEQGKAKINTSVVYPYEIVREYLVNRSDNDKTLNVIWENLPNYLPEGQTALVMADTSESMTDSNSLPLAVSISLALYMAERNSDPVFGGYFMTFSHNPELVKVTGNNLFERITNLSNASWGMNTNLQSAFDLILETAKKNKLSQDKMPSKLIIVSDMKFDAACGVQTNFEVIQNKYAEAGYEMPTIVFWNVNSSSGNHPVKFDQKGVILVSGCSPTIFKNVLSSKTTTPYELMLEVLNDERYNRVII